MASAEQAVAHITDEMLERLEENQAEIEAAAQAGDAARLSEADSTFHHLVAKASGNRVLLLSREPASLLFFPTTELICRRVPEGPPRLIVAHRHIIDALKARDLEQARLWMSRHLHDWQRGFARAGRDLDEPVERIYARSLPPGIAI